MTSRTKLDAPLLAITTAVIFVLICGFALFPAETNRAAQWAFDELTTVFGAPLLLVVFCVVLFLLWLAAGKYGHIRLGGGEPEYSTFSWVSMMVCCGISSALLFWAFTDWAYDFDLRARIPILGTASPYETATAYTFFHWGFSTWATYCVASLPIAYHAYVGRNPGLSLSAVYSAMRGRAPGKRLFTRAVDLVFLFTCCTGISIALGLSVPMITELFAAFFGFHASFTANVLVTLGIAAVFTASSWMGLASGMQRISRLCVRLIFVFVLCVFLVGPSLFLLKSTVNGVGIVLQNFIRMSLWTDPVVNGGFPEKWTVWYWLYDVSFTPFVGMFVTKISRVRTLRGLILNMLGSGSLGAFVVFGVLSHFSVHCDLSGLVPVTELVNAGRMNEAIVGVLHALPVGTLFLVLFGVVATLLLSTTLDSAAYTMAAALTPGLPADGHPLARHRLVCCLLLVAVPLSMMLVNAPLDTLKTCAIISGIPLCFVLGYLIYGFLRWMFQDFGSRSAEEIRAMHGEAPARVVQCCPWPPLADGRREHGAQMNETRESLDSIV